ncbi:30S ribosomal protein S14 [Candidatus Woesearchaeota archaeon]|nr:30S ribosomal protein S14 [Candidatus Woesearchaeota archaeon]
MTTKDYKKAFNQLNVKPIKKKKYIKNNAPVKKSCGLAKKSCQRCGRTGGHISKYGLNVCRHCFREIAQDLGFKKFK